MTKYESDFISNLIYYRELRGYTQSVLAGLCDRTKGNIGVIESGKFAPSFEMIIKIANALEIHPADLFFTQCKPKPRKYPGILGWGTFYKNERNGRKKIFAFKNRLKHFVCSKFQQELRRPAE